MMVRLRFVFLLVFSSAWLNAAEPVTVALMERRPSNSLAWNAHSGSTAYILGCDAILREFTDQTDAIAKVGAQRINGLVQAMESGLYFPTGTTLYEKWRPFLAADVFIEADLSRERLQWRAGTEHGDVYMSRVIEHPYRNPMAGAAALVRLVFESAGVDLPPEWEAELPDREPSPPELFVEWAKWIGYQPHWAHHAPWQASQQSAMRILNEDDTFSRGVAWALDMIQRDGRGFNFLRGHQPSPASMLQLPQALRLLDSRHAEAANRFIRRYLPDSGLLPQSLSLFDLPLLMGELAMDQDRGQTVAVDFGEGAPLNFEQLAKTLTGPRVRRNFAHAVGLLNHDLVREALAMLLTDDPDGGVRAAAARELASHHKGPPEALRTAFEHDPDPAVRSAALRGLIALDTATEHDLERAARDAAAGVRLALTESLHEAPVAPDRRDIYWLRFLADEDADVRVAAVRRMHRHSMASPDDEAMRLPLLAVLESGQDRERVAVLEWLADRTVQGFAGNVRPLLSNPSASVRAAAVKVLGRRETGLDSAVAHGLRGDNAPAVRRALASALAESAVAEARDILLELLDASHPSTRDAICSAAYRVVGADRAMLSKVMLFDASLTVNLAALRLLEKLADPALTRDVLANYAIGHSNPYVQADALRRMERHALPELHARCLKALESPRTGSCICSA